ncbi:MULTISPECIES: AIR synthase-related protein [Moorena]|nr:MULTISPECIES: AIR synthase-related protein [Moorena]
MVLDLTQSGIEIHCMRDLTRGGLASALNEIALGANLGIHIDESLIPVKEDLQGACEILGFDPLYVANEGRFVVILPEQESQKGLEIMRSHSLGKDAGLIGKVTDENSSLVTMQSKIGATRVVDLLSGQQLPRIC